MANKAISELPQAQNVNNQDLFVLEQGGIAKKLTAETFITEQGIIDALAEALDGHGGIQSVTLSSVSGRIRTYLITFTDQSATTFQVLDGTTITSIQKTSTAGLVDTYTVYMSDGTTSFFQVRNGQDGSATWDQINSKAPIITETVTGAIVNFPDGADDIPVTSLVANIEPKQSGSGDPTPDNIRPISGWTGCNVTRTGANVWDEQWELGSFNSRGEPSGSSTSIRCKNFIPVFPGNTYRYINGSGSSQAPWLYDKNQSFVQRYGSYMANGTTITIPEGCYYIKFALPGTYGTTYKNDVSWNYPSTATTYEPYQGNTVTVDWTSDAGTVYGGTIDVATGLLTVNKVVVDLGTLSWSAGSTHVTGKYRFLVSLPDSAVNSDTTVGVTSLCSQYVALATSGTFSAANNGYTINGSKIYIYDASHATDNDTTFRNAMSGVQLVYELATPQTYQLTPQEVKTLLGTNNVWADTGNVSVTYPADTKLYIEKLTMPTEDDLVANQAITSGKYFMIGNSLYLALANIASGAQITIGTNAQRVSLADALNTINS